MYSIYDMNKTRLGPHDGGSVDEWFAEEEGRTPGFISAIDAGAVRLTLVADLRRIREEAGLKQGEVAERAGTTQSAIARVESGKVMPSLDIVARIASACGQAFHYSFSDRSPARPDARGLSSTPRMRTRKPKRSMKK